MGVGSHLDGVCLSFSPLSGLLDGHEVVGLERGLESLVGPGDVQSGFAWVLLHVFEKNIRMGMESLN